MPRSLEKYYLFCDESSTSSRYTVIGATLMHETVCNRAEIHFDRLVEQHGGSVELKWTKCKKHNLRLYKSVCKAYFDALSRGVFKFQALVIDNSQMDHKTFNEGDKEIGFNKMLFTLLFSFVRKYRNRPRFYAMLDGRTTIHTPDRLRTMLNAKAVRDYNITHRPFRVCQFRNSEELRMIQLTDIICGAIAFQTNYRHIATDAAVHKVELAEYIASLAGLPFLSRPTPYGQSGFDIWHIDFEKAKGSRTPRR